jgi:hypothetical protein
MYQNKADKHLIDFQGDIYNPLVLRMVERLSRAIASDEYRDKMDIEDEVDRIFERELGKKDIVIAQKDKLIDETVKSYEKSKKEVVNANKRTEMEKKRVEAEKKRTEVEKIRAEKQKKRAEAEKNRSEVEIQKNIAKENNIAFWNLYENMGGYNSMIKWVEADTALANKDYTHLNFRGASLVSKMMLKSLMKGYDNWQNEIMMLKSKISKSKIKS